MVMRWRPVLACLLLTHFLSASPPAGAGPGSLIAGVCLLEVEVTTLATGWRNIATPVAGDCETSDGAADGALDGEFGPFPAYDCTGGIGDGHADLELAFTGGLSPSWTGTDLDVTNEGGVIEVVFFDLGGQHIVASGHFVQSAEETQACMAGATTVTWSGVLVFEDP